VRDIFVKVIFRIADEHKTAGGTAEAIDRHFDKLPPNVQHKLLFKLADNDRAALGVARGIAEMMK
jgi:hypothetical protein